MYDMEHGQIRQSDKERVLEFAIEKTNHLFYNMAYEGGLGLDTEEYRNDLLEGIVLDDDVGLSENQWKEFETSLRGIEFELEMRDEIRNVFWSAWSDVYLAVVKLITEKIMEVRNGKGKEIQWPLIQRRQTSQPLKG